MTEGGPTVGESADFIAQQMHRAQEMEQAKVASIDADDAENDLAAEEASAQAALFAVKLRQRWQRHVQEQKRDKQVLKLRKTLARYAIWIVIIQLGLANIFFGFYLVINSHDPNANVMIAWLSATVVEVIGILWVIARSLFPNRDKVPVGKSNDRSR